MRRSSILFVLIAIATLRAEASYYHHNLHGHRLTGHVHHVSAVAPLHYVHHPLLHFHHGHGGLIPFKRKQKGGIAKK
ncbi:hypothetical protein RB195_005059 [Necator americanus]|uniref:Uncharacterized protein n=1 Tax=Necator americanus TaxID=51031 RepID=A0ABR1BL08_NECAM